MTRAGATALSAAPPAAARLPIRGVCTLPAGWSFVDALAAGLRAQAGDDPLALAGITVLLPTRRACRALREAFLRQSGDRPVLLPRMSPLGDLDADALAMEAGALGAGELPGGPEALEIPAAVSGLRRQALLARALAVRGDLDLTPGQAFWLAADLGRLIDAAATEGLSFDRLAGLVPEELARHWQVTLDFLKLVTAHWPAILADEGAVDAAERRNRLLAARAALWRRAPPDGPVIAAGSTGSIPATAELLAVIADLPQGAVVLPGLDREMTEEDWQALDEPHPQAALKRLLERLQVARDEVPDWPVPPPGAAPAPDRAVLLREMFRPAATSEAWRGVALPAGCLNGLTRLEAPTVREEAEALALIMRGCLEEPDRTCALVTPDRGLARQVAAALARWGLVVDDSGGRPLADTPPGAFLRLIADAVAGDLAPRPLLALLKHPLAALNRKPEALRAEIRWLERRCLRGPRPAPGLAGLRAVLGAERGDDPPPALARLLDDLEAALAPLLHLHRLDRVAPASLAEAHLAAAEALAEAPGAPGPTRLWHGEEGEAVAAFAAELAEAIADLPPTAGRHYPELLEAALAGRVVRPRWGDHPRLFLWGPLEARLQHADLVILAGLNEGTWPAPPAADPWMSRPMRQGFGLPPPERRIGQQAHDVAQMLARPQVVLSRALRTGGAPSVPSRWLLRLEAVLGGAGLSLPAITAEHPAPWLAWLRQLDAAGPPRPCAPPAPCPPVAARPRRLSVSDVGTWMLDPYALYARKVLRLDKLDPLEADAGAAERGEIVHEALSAWLQAESDPAAPEAAGRLRAAGEAAFAALRQRAPDQAAFWWPRFLGLIDWLVAEQRRRAAAGARPMALECKGRLELPDAPAGPFALTARADRIDRLADGSLAIIDYKTGSVPSGPDIAAGYAPQLPLEAAMAEAGGFAEMPATGVAVLEHWRLAGTVGQVKPVPRRDKAGEDVVRAALEGLRAMIAAFDRPDTPYLSQPRPNKPPRFSDYAHLARVAEWSVGEGGEP